MNSPRYLRTVLSPVWLSLMRLHQAVESITVPIVNEGTHCLDVGCGEKPYRSLFSNCKYIGVDIEESGRPIDLKRPDFFYDGVRTPFDDNTFDLVICTQVLEHVRSPFLLIQEMRRVCKQGGLLIISLPFFYPEHEIPFDYFRFTRFGISTLLEEVKLEVKSIIRDSTAIETLAILTNVYIVTNFDPGIRYFRSLLALLICMPLQVFALILSKILPNKGSLYLNLVIHASKS